MIPLSLEGQRGRCMKISDMVPTRIRNLGGAICRHNRNATIRTVQEKSESLLQVILFVSSQSWARNDAQWHRTIVILE